MSNLHLTAIEELNLVGEAMAAAVKRAAEEAPEVATGAIVRADQVANAWVTLSLTVVAATRDRQAAATLVKGMVDRWLAQPR